MKAVYHRVRGHGPPVAQEKNGDWYDRAINHSIAPYRESRDYFLWCVVVDRVVRFGPQCVLDIGCGPGQVARFLYDRGLRHYVGIDLSPAAIKRARKQCPSFGFINAGVFDTDVFTTVKYDTVVCMEFLEHVVEDVAVLQRIARGTKFFGTVPSFPFESHVRHFSSAEEVVQRYRELFDPMSVDVIDAPFDGAQFFLIEGTRV